jgi:hypothetical protein
MSSDDKARGNKPAKEFTSADGLIKVAIWKQEGTHGPFYTVSCRRRYKDKKADEWKDSYSYGQDHVQALRKLLDLADTWILEQHQRASRKAAA